METTQTLLGINSDEPLPARRGDLAAEHSQAESDPIAGSPTEIGRKTRAKVAVIYALTTIIPLLVMFYIIQANIFLRNKMGVVTVSLLALIALGIALLGGKIMKEVWGKLNQAMEKIEHIREENEALKSVPHLEQSDEIDRIPSVVMHLVEVAKKQMNELKRYNEQVQDLNSRLREANEKLQQLSTEDSLTGLFNRRYFDHRVPEEVARTQRYGRDLALAMIDIDFFKDYNDNVGHPAGDKALTAIGDIIRKSIRETDLPFRYGGEELAIVMPETTSESATSVGERIRSAVEKQPFEGESSQPNAKLTVSIGIAVLKNGHSDVEEFVSAADKALYKAKSVGRNRLVALSEE